MNYPHVSVFIAMSLDGFIAAKNNGLDWLKIVESPGEDYGYSEFMRSVDIILMGRNTYDIVREFPEWPYGEKELAVLTHRSFESLHGEIQVGGDMKSVLEGFKAKGVQRVYIDGGLTIQSALREGLVSDLTISVIPILLGEGISLFGNLLKEVRLRTQSAQQFPSGLVQLKYEVLSSGELM